METTNRTLSDAQQVTGTSNWLQTFSSPMGAAAPAPSATPGATSVPTPAPAAPAIATPGAIPSNPNTTPLVGQLPGQSAAPAQPAPAPAAAPAPVEPVPLDFGGRKLPDTPDNRALYQDWKNQQAALTRAQQENLRLRQVGAQAPSQPAQPAPAPQPGTPAPAQVPAATANDVLSVLTQRGVTAEQFSASLYGDNPLQAVANVAQAVAQQIVQQQFQQMTPALQRADQFAAQYEVNQRIDAFAAQHQDFNTVLPQISDLFDQYPELNSVPHGLEIAYNMAKGVTAQPAAPAPSVPDLLKDQTVRSQILQDPQIRESIIQEHLRSVANHGPSAPVMAGPVAAGAPTLPASTPSTLKEATSRMLARMASQGIR